MVTVVTVGFGNSLKTQTETWVNVFPFCVSLKVPFDRDDRDDRDAATVITRLESNGRLLGAAGSITPSLARSLTILRQIKSPNATMFPVINFKSLTS